MNDKMHSGRDARMAELDALIEADKLRQVTMGTPEQQSKRAQRKEEARAERDKKAAAPPKSEPREKSSDSRRLAEWRLKKRLERARKNKDVTG